MFSAPSRVSTKRGSQLRRVDPAGPRNTLDVLVQHTLYHSEVPTVANARLDALARVGRALADETRCQLLLALVDGPSYPSALAARLGLSRANTSNHLACLRGCGLVVAEPEGPQVRYEISDANLTHALSDLADLVLTIDYGRACLNDRLSFVEVRR